MYQWVIKRQILHVMHILKQSLQHQVVIMDAVMKKIIQKLLLVDYLRIMIKPS